MRFTKCLCDHDIAQSLCVGCANGFWDFFFAWVLWEEGGRYRQRLDTQHWWKAAEIQTIRQKNKRDIFFVIDVYLFTLPSYKEVVFTWS